MKYLITAIFLLSLNSTFACVVRNMVSNEARVVIWEGTQGRDEIEIDTDGKITVTKGMLTAHYSDNSREPFTVRRELRSSNGPGRRQRTPEVFYVEKFVKHCFLLKGGDDRIRFHSGFNTYRDMIVFGGEGNDSIYGQAGVDHLFGEDGNDRIYGSDGDDFLYGGEGRDYLDGENGNDTISGGADNDIIYGRAGEDSLYGGEGTNQIYPGLGRDHIHYGPGEDIIHPEESEDEDLDRVDEAEAWYVFW